MNSKYLLLFSISLLLLSNTIHSQFSTRSKLAKANSKEEDGNYLKARKIYDKLLKKDSLNPKIYFAYGMNYHYYSVDKKEKGLSYLQKAYNLSRGDSTADYVYYLAESEKFNENYNQAINYYSVLLSRIKTSANEYIITEDVVSSKIKECQLAVVQRSTPKSFKVEHLNNNINTVNAEYAPIPYSRNNYLVYCSRDKINIGKKIDERDNKYFEDVYLSDSKNTASSKTNQLNKDSLFINLKNKKNHDAIAWKSQNDSLMILYRDNTLFLFTLKNGVYSEGKEIIIEKSEDVWLPHASIDLSKRNIYFSMDKPGGFGGLDIYKGTLNEDNTVTNIKNMGSVINSDLDEDSPNIDEVNNRLFFSSKNNSIGEYDIFVAELDSNSEVVSTKTMGYPYNSPGDDIYYINDNENNTGYFSSFRKGGNGDMDIYKLVPTYDCNPYQNKSFEVVIDASKSIYPKGEPVVYMWRFGDNTNDTAGLVVNHTYKRPGKYKVILDVKDVTTGRIELNEHEVDVVIDNVDYLEITSSDTLLVNSSDTISAKYCTLKNDSILEYVFTTGDGKEGFKGKELTYVYKNEGVYCQSLTLKTKNKKTYRTAKQIWVISKHTQDSLLALKKLQTENLNSSTVVNNTSLNDTKLNVDFSSHTKNDSKHLSDSIKNNLNKNLANTNFNNVNNQNEVATKNNVTNTQVSDLGSSILPIYFDFDKSFIRKNDFNKLDSIIQLANINQQSLIEITATCDSRGTLEYNLELSYKRAKATYNYLVKHGVNKKRIVGLINLGESKLYNNCNPCSKQQHQENRRATITLIDKIN